MHTLQVLEKKLGYTFRCKEQLQAALYHSSYANEHRCCGVSSNERLEFLGDAVLGLVTADYLYHKHPDLPEGDLTRMRAALVCEESLYEVAQSLGLGNELRLGKGEEAGGGRCRPSILADATESVFAAVYLDGGMEAARALIHRVLLDKEQEEAVEERRRDYKTELQELVQRRSNQTLHYEMIGATGPDHAKLFTCAVLLNGQTAGTGTGKSKKEAEQAAARAVPADCGAVSLEGAIFSSPGPAGSRTRCRSRRPQCGSGGTRCPSWSGRRRSRCLSTGPPPAAWSGECRPSSSP